MCRGCARRDMCDTSRLWLTMRFEKQAKTDSRESDKSAVASATGNDFMSKDDNTSGRGAIDARDTDLQILRQVFQEAGEVQRIEVLVVEDCDEDFFLIARCLNAMREYKVSVSHARTLSAAAALAQQEVFDLVMVDYWLGEDTGPQVLQALGGRHGKAPAILVTGLDHPAYKRAALKAGAIQCVSKDLLTGTILQDAIQSVRLTHRIEAALLRGAA